MQSFYYLKQTIDSMEKDMKEFFNKDNFEASIRIRWKLQQVRRMAKELRLEITKLRKDREIQKHENFQP